MPSPTVEELIGRALSELLRQQRLSSRDLERRLGLPALSLEPLLGGRGTIDMDLLRRVLTLLGVAPESLFAGVFAADAGGGAASHPASAPDRHQVAHLLDRVSSALAQLASERC